MYSGYIGPKHVHRVVGNMCAFGMLQEDSQGTALVKKPTGFMTNAPCVAARLAKPCLGGHRHIHLINGRARRAEVYPEELCYEILQGIIQQMREDGRIAGGGCVGHAELLG